MADQEQQPQSVDLINHPPHYRAGDVYETTRVIEAWELPYDLGNALKYISRAGRKTTDSVSDLKKAEWYIRRAIERLSR